MAKFSVFKDHEKRDTRFMSYSSFPEYDLRICLTRSVTLMANAPLFCF